MSGVVTLNKNESVSSNVLKPPKDPSAAIASRRNPCYGYAVVSYFEQNSPEMNTQLMEFRNGIIAIVDPERNLKKHPRKLMHLIKNKSLHASLYGSTPFLKKSDYFDFYQAPDGAQSGRLFEDMRDKLKTFLDTKKPILKPMQLEYREDGTIIARFEVITQDGDNRPLVTLKTDFDSSLKQQGPTWDPNPLRDSTLAVVLCVTSLSIDSTESDSLQQYLAEKNLEFTRQPAIPMNHCSIIDYYDKRTLTREKHANTFAEVSVPVAKSSYQY